MSEVNSNEKKADNRTNNSAGGSENHRNHRNNGYRKYHSKKPYQKNNEKNVAVAEGKENVQPNATSNNVAQNPVKKNPAHVRNFPKKTGENVADGNKDVKRNPRQGGFDRRKNNHGNVRVEETIQDIDIDIGRIEKEIELEIKEIAAFKFGL